MNDAIRTEALEITPQTVRKPIAGNTATGILKLIALCFMLIDHMGAVVFVNATWMRVLGRIAFPLYSWCLVVGFHYTRSVPRYLGRILLVGLVSQPLYAVVMNHSILKPNIFLTLALALCALWGIREKRFGSHLWAPILAMAAAVVFGCDYGWRGVLVVILLYAARSSRAAIAAVMASFCLYWGTPYRQLSSFLFINLGFITNGIFPTEGTLSWLGAAVNSAVRELLSPWFRMQAMAILSLPLMLIPMQQERRLPTWAGYALYPAHLVVVLLVKLAVLGSDQIVMRLQNLLAP